MSPSGGNFQSFTDAWIEFNESFKTEFEFDLDLGFQNIGINFYQNDAPPFQYRESLVGRELNKIDASFISQARESRSPKVKRVVESYNRLLEVWRSTPRLSSIRKGKTWRLYGEMGVAQNLLADLKSPETAWWNDLNIETLRAPNPESAISLDVNVMASAVKQLPHFPDVRFMDPDFSGWIDGSDISKWQAGVRALRFLCDNHRRILPALLSHLCSRLDPKIPVEFDAGWVLGQTPNPILGHALIDALSELPTETTMDGAPTDVESPIKDQFWALPKNDLLRSARNFTPEALAKHWESRKKSKYISDIQEFKQAFPDLHSPAELFSGDDALYLDHWANLSTHASLRAEQERLKQTYLEAKKHLQTAERNRDRNVAELREDYLRARFRHIFFFLGLRDQASKRTNAFLREGTVAVSPAEVMRIQRIQMGEEPKDEQFIQSFNQRFEQRTTQRNNYLRQIGFLDDRGNIVAEIRDFYWALSFMASNPAQFGLDIDQNYSIDDVDLHLLRDVLLPLFPENIENSNLIKNEEKK